MSKEYKQNLEGANRRIIQKSFKDSSVLNYTHNEVESIFLQNLKYCDSDLIQSALTPLSTKQQDAVAWLDDYGKSFGDQSPNSTEVAINVPTKKEVYDDYVMDMKSFGEPYVCLSIFENLWRTIFQHFQLRQWVGIPGKCSTCDDIDTIRKKSLNKSIREAAKQAHLLHRGGLFMAERQTYVNY